jgi:16S rRNA G966 N2-methylase RsmD
MVKHLKNKKKCHRLLYSYYYNEDELDDLSFIKIKEEDLKLFNKNIEDFQVKDNLELINKNNNLEHKSTKEYIDNKHPNRHTLILGDSTETVPKYINDNPDKTFDIIFIDGGHDYKIADADLENCKKLANKDTIVIMDDTIHTRGWKSDYTIGPTLTWLEHLNNHKITEINKVDYCSGRGMSWGKYVF